MIPALEEATCYEQPREIQKQPARIGKEGTKLQHGTNGNAACHQSGVVVLWTT